jgi:hypothetical protein
MSPKTLTAPKHERLDDELLSNVHGGGGHGNSRPDGHGGNGTGGGDGLGWLRNFLRGILR